MNKPTQKIPENTVDMTQTDRVLTSLMGDLPTTEDASPPEAKQLKSLLAGPFDVKTVSIVGLFLIAVFFTLSEARDLILPVVISLLLTSLLDPIVRGLQRLRIPRSLAAAWVLLSFLALFAFGVHHSMQPTREWIEAMPRSMRQAERKLTRLLEPVEEVNEAARQVERLAKMPSGNEAQTIEVSSDPSLGESLFDGTQSLLLMVGVVLILTYFLLASGDLFLQKVVRMLPRMTDRKKVVRIARLIRQDVSTHLFTISLINSLLGISVGLAAYLVGVPHPIVWGVMAALFNFVPYVGAMAGTVIIFVASLLHFDQPWQALLLPSIYILLTALEGSLLTPMILGKRLSLNPVVIFLGLFFWGWIWGVAGALLAVPLLIAFKIICDHLEPLEPIGELLGR